jgi:hypothetical protein
MKHKILLLITSGVLLCMIYCRKGNTGNTDALTGKWQEVKLRTYTLDSGKITHDTTYLNSFFNKWDYAQFNSGDTCKISSYEVFFTPEGVDVNPQSIETAHYIAIGNGKFILNGQSTVTPGGVLNTDTISVVNNNTILIHNVLYSLAPKHESISDAYYQK